MSPIELAKAFKNEDAVQCLKDKQMHAYAKINQRGTIKKKPTA